MASSDFILTLGIGQRARFNRRGTKTGTAGLVDDSVPVAIDKHSQPLFRFFACVADPISIQVLKYRPRSTPQLIYADIDVVDIRTASRIERRWGETRFIFTWPNIPFHGHPLRCRLIKKDGILPVRIG